MSTRCAAPSESCTVAEVVKLEVVPGLSGSNAAGATEAESRFICMSSLVVALGGLWPPILRSDRAPEATPCASIM